MKKLLFFFILFSTVTINAQRKGSLTDALENIGLTEVQLTESKAVQNEKLNAFREIRESNLSKEEQKEKRKEINIKTQSKLLAIIGKEKLQDARAYMKANK